MLCTILLVVTGCAHRRVLERTAGPEAFRLANETFSDRSGEVLTQSGQLFRWRFIRVEPDSTYGSPVAAGPIAPLAVPTASVREVAVRSHWRGALDGALIGAGIGVILGAMAGGDEACYGGSFPCYDTAEVLLLGGTTGAVWGVTVGAIRGSRIKVQIR